MDIRNVGKRGILFTFYDLGIATNVYIIRGEKRFYVIDTYLGPEVMRQVNQYIIKEYDGMGENGGEEGSGGMQGTGGRAVIVVNTHSHWDHIWGNSLYSSGLIISHSKCREHIREQGLHELEKYGKYQRGEVVITLPNLTFTDEMLFEDDGILLYYTPGHTDDGLSVLETRDRVLFAGDNLERPVPSLSSRDLNGYARTLEEYLRLDFQAVIGGHTGIEGKSLVTDNLNYIKKVLSGDCAEFETGAYAENHRANMDWLRSGQ